MQGTFIQMSDFSVTWSLSRGRFDAEVAGLFHEQLVWKPHAAALSIGQMALHVAGVEVFFVSQLKAEELSGDDRKLSSAATQGVVNDETFPFTDEEITPHTVAVALARGRELVMSLIEDASNDVRKVEIVSALGPVITGEGAFARLSFHPAYHHGQAYQLKNSPDFPK